MPRSSRALAYAALLAVGLVVFGQVVRFGFVTADDTIYIASNPHVSAWWQTPLRDRFLTLEFHYAMPVTLASFALDWALWSGRAQGFHLTNLVLHLACAALVLRILLREVRLGAALAGAFLFLLHPVQAEAVAFVTQRKDLLAAFFALLALDALRAHGEVLRRRDVGWIVFCSAASALSKPTGAMVGLALALAYFVWRRAHLVPALLAGVSLGVVALDMYIARSVGQVVDLGPMSFARRAGFVGSTFTHYLGTLFVPVELAPRVVAPTTVDLVAIAVAAVFAVLVAMRLSWAIRRGEPRATLIGAWLVFAYVPISNLVPISRYAADAYLYVAMVGIAFAFAAGVERLLEWLAATSARRIAPVIVHGTLSLSFAVLALSCAVQTSVWRDEERLFGYIYLLLPTSQQAYEEYADRLVRNGKRDEARRVELEFYTRAVATWPQSLGARQRLVHVHVTRGDLAAARRTLDETPTALRNLVGYWEAVLEWASAAQQWNEALSAVRAIVTMQPMHPARVRIPELEAKVKP